MVQRSGSAHELLLVTRRLVEELTHVISHYWTLQIIQVWPQLAVAV